MIEDSRFLRDAAIDRLRSALNGVGASHSQVMAYAGDGPAPADIDRLAVWTRGFGAWGSWNSDGNAAKLDRSIGGLFVGADAPMFDNGRIGLVTGYSRSNFNAKDRNSSGTSDNYHFGLYGGAAWGDLSFRSGAAYTWHDLSTSRSVSFPGFSDKLKSDYDAGTAQVYGEIGYGFRAGRVALEPFVNLAYVSLRTDGFTEQGGAAALASNGATTDATFTTLGIHASTSIHLGGTKAAAEGTLGWRHAFGDTPKSILSFTGGSPFTIAGVPIAKDAAVFDAGLDVSLSPNATLGVSYGGQFGSDVTDQSVKANFSLKF
jgi:outer membrane autotransporter protein